MKYLVLEVQTNASGQVGSFVFSFDTRDEADSKYHALLSIASVSDIPIHCVYMFSNNGHFIDAEPHFHGVQPESVE